MMKNIIVLLILTGFSVIRLMVLYTKDSDPDEVIAISERVKAYKYYYWKGTRWAQIVEQ